jgi:hypothetical protein
MKLAELSKILKRPLLSELVLGRDVRPCERCKTLTFWFKPRQRAKGFCPDHALDDGRVGLGEVVAAVQAQFPEDRHRVLLACDLRSGRLRRDPRAAAHPGSLGQVGSPVLVRHPGPSAGRRPLRGLPATDPGLWARRPPVLLRLREEEDMNRKEASHRARRKRHPGMDWALDVPPGCRCHWTAFSDDDGWYLVAIAEDCRLHPLAA